MKILIVEDDPVSRRLLESFLSGWGHDVQLAVNGREAWAILQNPDAPNLVVSDWMMPEMDGLELCRRIRATGKSGYIYFIMWVCTSLKHPLHIVVSVLVQGVQV